MKGSYYDAQGGQFCSFCGAWRGELGLEPTPELYIEHLMAVFDALKRVLRDDGICFVNIGDTYGGHAVSKEWAKDAPNKQLAENVWRSDGRNSQYLAAAEPRNKGLPDKCMCLIPERFVLAMAEHGWIVRCKIVWAKGVSFCDTYSGSCMPDSAKDRPNKNGYEMVYMFTKKKHYWYEQQYEEHSRDWTGCGGNIAGDGLHKYSGKMINPKDSHPKPVVPNPLGRTIRNVWCINPQAYSEAHFATYPEKLVEPLIKMAVPEQVCKKCGLGRRKVLKPTSEYQKILGQSWTAGKIFGKKTNTDTIHNLGRAGFNSAQYEFSGLTDCGCNKGWRPGVALDPFMGSGTVAVVAYELRRDYIGIELQADYVQLSRRRLAQHRDKFSLLERE